MRVVLAGYGTTARTHARVLQAEGVEIVSVVGRVPEATAAFAGEYHIPHWTTTLEEALSLPRIDAAILCTPSALHARQVALALSAGMHTLVEIPLALSYREALALTEQAESRQRVLMVAHTHRYGLANQEVKRRIEAGLLHPTNIINRYVFLRREDIDWTGHRRSWRDNLLWHHGCHAVDMCLWLLGEHTPARCHVLANIADPDPVMQIPMDLSLLIRSACGALAAISMSYNSHINRYDYLIIGQETTLLISEGQLSGPEGLVPLTTDEGASSPVVKQDREFIAAIQEGRAAAISGRSVLPAMWTLQQAQDAWQSNQNR